MHCERTVYAIKFSLFLRIFQKKVFASTQPALTNSMVYFEMLAVNDSHRLRVVLIRHRIMVRDGLVLYSQGLSSPGRDRSVFCVTVQSENNDDNTRSVCAIPRNILSGACARKSTASQSQSHRTSWQGITRENEPPLPPCSYCRLLCGALFRIAGDAAQIDGTRTCH